MGESKRVSFNINAELYEDEFGELAVKVPGEKVFRNVGLHDEDRFQKDVVDLLEKDRSPSEWAEMPAHELNGRNWHCVARLGYLEGDPERPAVEFEGDPKLLGNRATSYLGDAGLNR